MASQDGQQRVQRRLLEERARLEAKVTAQIDAERLALVERRRQEQHKAQPDDAPAPLDLDAILEENRRKLEEARGRSGSGVAQTQVPLICGCTLQWLRVAHHHHTGLACD